MKAIFVLYWCYGEYEDKVKRPLTASMSPEKLADVEETHRADLQQRIMWNKQFKDWEGQYYIEHPQDPALFAHDNVLADVWDDAFGKASGLFLDGLGVPTDKRNFPWELECYMEHSFYKIEEIPWVE